MLDTLHRQGEPLLQWGVVISAALVAAAWDLASRRIPNGLTVPVFVVGVVWAVAVAGVAGLLDSLLGGVLLAFPYLLLFLFAGGGAGDVKLMAGIGVWLGTINGLIALVGVAVAGIALGVIFALKKRKMSVLLAKMSAFVWQAMAIVRGGRKSAEGLGAGGIESIGKMPYGVAILAGVVLAAVGALVWQTGQMAR
ncbi:MAG: prepilin peptidase [Planctomycetota bacterium]|jgi:prepilin peptidase CpaA